MVDITGIFKKLVLVLVVSIIIATTFLWAKKSVDDFERTVVLQTQQHLLTIAKAHAERIENLYKEIQSRLEMLALDKAVQRKIRKETGVIEITGQTYDPIENVLESFAKGAFGEGVVVSLSAIDSKGIVRQRIPFAKGAFGAKSAVGTDYSQKQDVKLILESNRKNLESSTENHISSVFTESNQRVFSICVPVFEDDRFTGLLRALVSMEAVDKIIRYVETSSVYAWIIDENAIVLSHPETERIGKDIFTTRKEFFPEYDYSELEILVQQMTEGKENADVCYLTKRQDGAYLLKNTLVAFTPIEIGSRLWSIAVLIGYFEVSEPVRSQFAKIFTAAGALIVIFGVSGLWFYGIQKRSIALENKAKSAKRLESLNKDLQFEIKERVQAEKNLKQAKDQAEKAHEEIKLVNKKLKTTYTKLVEISHQAGMAEVATDVLHNVGNVLNSVNVSATLISEKITKSEVANLKKLSDLIREHEEDIISFISEDPKGKHIPKYIAQVGEHLANEQADIVEKLQSLVKNIEHIKNIVKMQQQYARVSTVEVEADLNEIIENAIQINQADLERNQIGVVRECADFGIITINRQKVLQILVNLIGNAKYALISQDNEDKTITIKSYMNGEDSIRIDVIDNGIGIAKENLKKIFTHGFTTKKHGHGFGLHSGSLGAKEIGGSLIAHSQGPGKGATFTLELPFKAAEKTQCTA